DDDNAFDHPRENGFHSAAVAGQFPESAPELVNRLVERPRHSAEFIVAEIERRRREVAAAIPAGHGGDPADAASDPSRDPPRDAGGADERQAQRKKRG